LHGCTPSDPAAAATVLIDAGAQPAQHGAQWLALPAAPAACGLARGFVASSLSNVEPEVVDVAVLLTSELVANAVLHGLAPIGLQLHRPPGAVRIEVRDAGPIFTAPATAGWNLSDEGGRGLPLLDALATAWGSCTIDDGTAGKVLWFELACTSADGRAVPSGR
jgi:anti-sigma regulatory factor (Ser/Thr protein kinase)